MAGGEFRLGTVATYMSTYISILTISHNPYRKHIHVNHPASTNLGFGVLPPNLDLRYVELRPRHHPNISRLNKPRGSRLTRPIRRLPGTLAAAYGRRHQRVGVRYRRRRPRHWG